MTQFKFTDSSNLMTISLKEWARLRHIGAQKITLGYCGLEPWSFILADKKGISYLKATLRKGIQSDTLFSTIFPEDGVQDICCHHHYIEAVMQTFDYFVSKLDIRSQIYFLCKAALYSENTYRTLNETMHSGDTYSYAASFDAAVQAICLNEETCNLFYSYFYSIFDASKLQEMNTIFSLYILPTPSELQLSDKQKMLRGVHMLGTGYSFEDRQHLSLLGEMFLSEEKLDKAFVEEIYRHISLKKLFYSLYQGTVNQDLSYAFELLQMSPTYRGKYYLNLLFRYINRESGDNTAVEQELLNIIFAIHQVENMDGLPLDWQQKIAYNITAA